MWTFFLYYLLLFVVMLSSSGPQGIITGQKLIPRSHIFSLRSGEDPLELSGSEGSTCEPQTSSQSAVPPVIRTPPVLTKIDQRLKQESSSGPLIRSSIPAQLLPTLSRISSSSSGHNITGLPADADGIRFCINALDCHLDLNERCVPRDTFSVCDCRQPFLRNQMTGLCEMKKAVQMKIRFNSLEYNRDLSRKNSPSFIRTKEVIEVTLLEVFRSSNVLKNLVKDIKVMGFSSGSLTVSFLLLMADTSSAANSKESLALLLVKEISVSVHELNSTNSSTAYNMMVTELETDVNQCEFEDLNYCSPDALCLKTRDGFSCICDDRYTDHSPHPSYPGEVCSVECPLNYCENDGHCHVDKEFSRLYCTCNNWNVGVRCQYSGVVVFSVLGVVMILLLFVVGCTAAAFCGRSRISAPIVNPSTSQSGYQSKPMSPNAYDDHIRPFRITIDNPYDGHDPHQNIQNVERHVRISPRHSLEDNERVLISDHHCPIQPSSCLSSCNPSPRTSISAGVQTESGQTQISLLTPPPTEVALDRPARGLKVPNSCLTNTALSRSSKLKFDDDQRGTVI